MAFPDYKIDVYKHIMRQIKKIITDTFRATCFKIDPQRLHNSFEVMTIFILNLLVIWVRFHVRLGFQAILN